MPDNAVFISYAREDLPAVQRLKAGLDAAGITHVVRSRPPRRRRRLRPQDPAQHRALLVFHSGRLGDDRAAARGLFPARVELCDRSRRATSPKARCSSCRSASTTRTRPTAHVPDKFKALHITRLPGGEVTPEFARHLQDLPAARAALKRDRRARLDDTCRRSTARTQRRSTPRIRGSASPRSPRKRGRYFYGREEEVAELARRVQRKLLTLLFGQSGLGKTSILRAGIVPRLRALGYCPVYVRIDYSRDSPPPSEQIKQAIFRATRGVRDSGRRPASRSPANRCGNSCTTATTCCATRPAGR